MLYIVHQNNSRPIPVNVRKKRKFKKFLSFEARSMTVEDIIKTLNGFKKLRSNQPHKINE
jgi:hypothetical protein